MARPSLCKKIAERILADFALASALPGERELAERYECNRLTLRKALKALNEAGLLESRPRDGHFMTPAAREPANTATPPPVIVMLSTEERLRDPAHTYVVGGAIHQARIDNVNLVLREIGNPAFGNAAIPALNELHPGIAADGYVIAGAAPMALLECIRRSGRPCVMLGRFYEQPEGVLIAGCQQLLIAISYIYLEVGRHLRDLGHRKIAVASTYEGGEDVVQALRQAYAEKAGMTVTIDRILPIVARHERTPEKLRQAACDTVRRLDGDTALVVPEGHIYALEIVRQLQRRHLEFPQELSLVIQGCETDWFIDSYQISCVYAEYRDQGMACIREVLRQLQNGCCESGIRYTPVQYIMRASTGKARETRVGS